MTYFIILPAYIALLLCLIVAAVATRCVASWRAASSYIVAGTICTLPGFIIANVVVTLAGILPVLVTRNISPPQWLQQVAAITAGGILILGPFVASVIGVFLGFAVGVFLVFRRRKRRAVRTA